MITYAHHDPHRHPWCAVSLNMPGWPWISSSANGFRSWAKPPPQRLCRWAILNSFGKLVWRSLKFWKKGIRVQLPALILARSFRIFSCLCPSHHLSGARLPLARLGRKDIKHDLESGSAHSRSNPAIWLAVVNQVNLARLKDSNTFRCDRTKGDRTRLRMFGGAFPVTVELWHVINGGTVIHFPFQRHYAQLHHSSGYIGYVACEQPVQVWTVHLSLPRCETLSTTSVTRPQSSILIDSPCATRSGLEGLSSRAPWERCVFGFKSFVVLQPAPTLIPRFFATYWYLLYQIDVTASAT